MLKRSMQNSFQELIQEISTTINAGEIVIDGKTIELEFFLGGNYKVMLYVNAKLHNHKSNLLVYSIPRQKHITPIYCIALLVQYVVSVSPSIKGLLMTNLL